MLLSNKEIIAMLYKNGYRRRVNHSLKYEQMKKDHNTITYWQQINKLYKEDHKLRECFFELKLSVFQDKLERCPEFKYKLNYDKVIEQLNGYISDVKEETFNMLFVPQKIRSVQYFRDLERKAPEVFRSGFPPNIKFATPWLELNVSNDSKHGKSWKSEYDYIPDCDCCSDKKYYIKYEPKIMNATCSVLFALERMIKSSKNSEATGVGKNNIEEIIKSLHSAVNKIGSELSESYLKGLKHGGEIPINLRTLG